MIKLEETIRNNRPDFDDRDPDPGHFLRFEHRLDENHRSEIPVFSRDNMLKVAAIIVLLISFSVLAFDLVTREIGQHFFTRNTIADLPVEVQEAMQYYDQKVDVQLGEINKLAGYGEKAADLKNAALKQIRVLDENTLELRKNLNDNPGNERIQEAILQNQKMKQGVLDNILFQLKEQKY